MGNKAGEAGLKRWTRQEDDVLVKAWKEGQEINAITLLLDRTKKAIIARRKYLLLPARRTKKETHGLHIYVSEEVHDAIKRRARQKGMTITAYLRWIVKKDTG